MKAHIEIALSEMLTAQELKGLAARAEAERRPIESLILEAIREMLASSSASAPRAVAA